ncbi:thiol:disulfide interchange protein DsbA/DsbL [Rhodanobacter koreensis]
MLKRMTRLRAIFLLGGLLLASACTAQSSAPAPYTEGNEYVTLPAPYQRYSSAGKVEVVEVFSYGCIHCAHFAPIAEKLRKELPAGVTFKLVPAPFNAEWLPFARAYYAADQLGVVDRTHLQLFAAKFDQHYPINSMDELADFYAREGVDRAKFLSIATSPEATAKLKSDLSLIQHWQVDGTPSIVVDGKYRVNNVHSLDEIAAVAVWLAKRELGGK